MRKEKKQKKQKNSPSPKKSLSQKITGINTTSNISYGNVDVNPKDKRVKWLFGVAIVSLLAVGIGVPIGIAGIQYISQKPYSTGDEVYPGGPTVGDMITVNKDKDQINKNAEKIENIVVEKLYREEREAFLKFEAFVNNTKYKGTSDKVGPTTFGVDVSKSFEDIKKSQEQELNNAKKAMRESYPLDWAQKWDAELKSEKYGGSNTDEQAIDYLTKTKAKDAAFARFNTAEINTTSWTQADFSLQAKQNIVYKNDEGIEQTIPAGTQLFASTFLNVNGNNVAIPSERDPIAPSSEIKIAVYQTKSYVLQERNPLNRLPNLYNEYFKSANISSVSLPFVQNSENSELELTITPELLINLFTMSRTESGELITPFNTISNFEGASTLSTRQDKDKTIINTLSQSSSETAEASTRKPATTGSQLGSSKVTSLATLIKGEENELRAFHAAAISAMKTPTLVDGLFKIKEANPINIFLESILKLTSTSNPNISDVPLGIQKLVQFLNAELVPTYAVTPVAGKDTITFNLKPNFDIFAFNKGLKEKMKDIPTRDFNNIFNTLLNSSFRDENPYAGFVDAPTIGVNDVPKKWTVYQIGVNTFLYVDGKGLKVYNIETLVGNPNPALKMLKSDIQNTIDVTSNPDQVILYDVATQYNKIATPEIINKILIEENKNEIIVALKESGDTDPDKTVKDVYDNLINVINNTINPDVKSAMTGLSLFLEELIKPMNSYDFFENSEATGPINIKFMNNSQYANGNLNGYLLIESQFDDKLRSIISVVAKRNATLFPSSRGVE